MLFDLENPSNNLVGDVKFKSKTSFDSKIQLLNLTYETKTRHYLSECFGEYQEGKMAKFYTDGAWSMHQLAQYFIELIGPADVVISTWTMTENPARILLSLKESGMIRKLTGLFDYRIHDRSPKNFQLISSICDKIALVKCHAKVTTITNDSQGVSIVGSANYSKNLRLEAGTVFMGMDNAQFDKSWIERKIDEATE
jgi:hypothetical protein